MPKKQRNRDKNRTKKYQTDEDKQIKKETLDISQEVLDEIDVNEDCKLTYIFGHPPLLKIQRKDKENIITHRFSIGQPYLDREEKLTGAIRKKTHCMIKSRNGGTLNIGNVIS